jgi:hypothetical protein
MWDFELRQFPELATLFGVREALPALVVYSKLRY